METNSFQFLYFNVHQGHKLTPLYVMNSVAIHGTCKSKTLISSFNKFGLCISYDELMYIHRNIASYTVQSVENGMPLLFSVDANKFTVAVMLQNKTNSQQGKPNVSQINVAHGPKAFYAKLNCLMISI